LQKIQKFLSQTKLWLGYTLRTSRVTIFSLTISLFNNKYVNMAEKIRDRSYHNGFDEDASLPKCSALSLGT
jgi:hypothetical protein